MTTSVGRIAAAIAIFVVAIAMSGGGVEAARPLKPQLVFDGTEPNGTLGTYYNLSVSNYADFPAALFASEESNPDCGNNTAPSRTWVDIYNARTNEVLNGFCTFASPADLNSAYFFVPTNGCPPASVYMLLTDQVELTTYKSNNLRIPRSAIPAGC